MFEAIESEEHETMTAISRYAQFLTKSSAAY